MRSTNFKRLARIIENLLLHLKGRILKRSMSSSSSTNDVSVDATVDVNLSSEATNRAPHLLDAAFFVSTKAGDLQGPKARVSMHV